MTPAPGRFANDSGSRERADLGGRGPRDRLGDRVLRGVLERAREAQQLGALDAGCRR